MLVTAMSVAGVVAMVAPAVAKPTRKQKKKAVKHFKAGAAHFKAGRFGEALERLQKADDLDPNPMLKINIAETLEELDRPDEALRWYLEVQGSNAGKSLGVDARRAVERLREELAPKEGTLSIRSPAKGAEVSIDGELAGRAPLEVDVPAGLHEVTLTSPDGLSITERVRVAAGATVELMLTPPADSLEPEESFADEPPPPSAGAGGTPWGWIAAGAGTGLVVAGVGVFMAHQADVDDLPPGESLETIKPSLSYSLLALGVVGLGYGVYRLVAIEN